MALIHIADISIGETRTGGPAARIEIAALLDPAVANKVSLRATSLHHTIVMRLDAASIAQLIEALQRAEATAFRRPVAAVAASDRHRHRDEQLRPPGVPRGKVTP